jgi:hypothetical protein
VGRLLLISSSEALENQKSYEANQANNLAKNFFKHKSNNHLDIIGGMQEPQIIISAASGNN